ncbi:undecaprenyl-diphosphate phosphatase [Pseudomonas sp. S37]|uniref:undecaprenyl-diphosphate phosphatase n=1 Tax=Pseudomonas sp. S37 TaxID=2767449 RepID=UPI0019120D9F|nr:undecaprenyl-diphosphate phosphatase [Pseudomonas sp. S37]MBK4992228.1 undecaprenyl-diphosphate phosphatase [Pseudomonas sp. S37]
MDFIIALQAIVLGIVEGLTEFLPISSTGHQIIVADLINFAGDGAMAFTIIIQLGAILAVVWEYRLKLIGVAINLTNDRKARSFTFNMVIAFLPAAVCGVAFAGVIHHYLFNPIIVAAALIVGGMVMLWAEKRMHPTAIDEVDNVQWRSALKIGCAQCLALIPGTSRSGATIIGGLVFGLSRKAATEFSFFLAMPTMLGAAVYSAFKYHYVFQVSDIPSLLIGLLISFICAKITLRALLRFISSRTYVGFAWYRITFGVFILLSWQLNWIDWSSSI